MSLVTELRRRNVLRMAALYMLSAWLVMQVAGELIDLGNLPEWIGPPVLLLLAIGFPIAVALSWFYEITPAGITLDSDPAPNASSTGISGRGIDFVVISLLLAAVLTLAYEKWWPAGQVELSIAVLPFENLSADPDQEYFSDGISDEVLNVLAQTPDLRVISRHSSFAFKGKQITVPEVAEQLKVTHVLEGSVRRSGDRLRVTAQLIDARSDTHLWSESYDRPVGDIFAVEDDISRSVGEALKVRLLQDEGEARLSHSNKTSSVHAYEAYLRGRELVLRRERYDEAISHFERALRLDDNFAQAHAQLGIAIILDRGSLEERARRANFHFDRAQMLEPELADIYGGRALLARLQGDPEVAIRHAQRALESNPNYVDAINWLQMALVEVGRFEEARQVRAEMLVFDPLNVIGLFNQSWYLGAIGRIDDAHAMADRLVEQSRRMGFFAHGQISLIWEGDIDSALFWFLQSQAAKGVDQRRMPATYFVSAFAWVGLHEEARRVDGDGAFLVDIAQGRFEEAVWATQEQLERNADAALYVLAAAEALYEAGRIVESHPLYERLTETVPPGNTIGNPFGAEDLKVTMRLAQARRIVGDESGAEAAADIVRTKLMKMAANQDRVDGGNHRMRLGRALLAAFNGENDVATRELRSAVHLGLRDRRALRDAILENLEGDPELSAVRENLEEALKVERENVLELVCFNNPTPSDWQPLPGTCEGVGPAGG